MPRSEKRRHSGTLNQMLPRSPALFHSAANLVHVRSYRPLISFCMSVSSSVESDCMIDAVAAPNQSFARRAGELVKVCLRAHGTALREAASTKGRKPATGRTIMRRIRIRCCQDESGRCSVSGEREVYGTAPLFTHRTSTISTKSATPASRLRAVRSIPRRTEHMHLSPTGQLYGVTIGAEGAQT